ncbi:MAG: ATP-dependent DNA helicase RecG [Tractidigestivibacter sp.]
MGGVPSVSPAADKVERTLSLADGVGRLRYVTDGKKSSRRQALERLGIHRVRDLFLHVPSRYLDYSHKVVIGMADVGAEATIVAQVDRITLKRPRPRMQIVEMYVVDSTGVLQASFFRQPWLADQVKRGDWVALSGKVTFDYGFKRMTSPFIEVLGSADEAATYGRVLPVHPVGEGISTSWMRRIISCAIADVGDVCDWVPAQFVESHGLMSLSRAISEVHFPSSLASAEAARRRLAYDELLSLQVALLSRRGMELSGVTPTRHVTDGPRMAALLGAMPFSLTDEQRAAADDILADMAAPHVMNRLLLGDVGTGKTAVAAVALAAVADTGTQAAVMAPTSVLASQYAEKLGPVLDASGITWTLITGSTPPAERAEATERISSGETSVTFGTTAMLSDDIAFKELTLVVIDEQHRFGVDQRAALRRKGAAADLLAMTATPIPRTLALSIYGDMGCSRIKRRPRAGAGVTTKVITPSNLDLAYASIREAVNAGHQAYVICPLVDDTDDGSDLDDVPDSVRSRSDRVRSATATLEELSQRVFPDLRCDLLHGRMSAAEKDEVMARFRAGKSDILVSTTVVEVGVDVPNATVMLVHDADRFGLATLHQLRGRVGRGDWAGQVWLSCAAKKGTPARQRLAALESTSDGFELAELDLKLRREGEVLGYRQHGGVTLRISDLSADADLVEAAHKDALALFDKDPKLQSAEGRPCAIEARERFSAYFDEVRRA